MICVEVSQEDASLYGVASSLDECSSFVLMEAEEYKLYQEFSTFNHELAVESFMVGFFLIFGFWVVGYSASVIKKLISLVE